MSHFHSGEEEEFVKLSRSCNQIRWEFRHFWTEEIRSEPAELNTERTEFLIGGNDLEKVASEATPVNSFSLLNRRGEIRVV